MEENKWEEENVEWEEEAEEVDLISFFSPLLPNIALHTREAWEKGIISCTFVCLLFFESLLFLVLCVCVQLIKLSSHHSEWALLTGELARNSALKLLSRI